MLVLMALLLANQPMDIDMTIRDHRSAYNAAIASRDLPAIESVLAPDYIVLPGLTGTPLSRGGLVALFARSFEDPTFVTYVRSPDRIEPSSSSKRAAETGHWVGTWNKPDGRMTVSGVYQAYWIPQRDRWVLVNESFVTLRCEGSRECASVD